MVQYKPKVLENVRYKIIYIDLRDCAFCWWLINTELQKKMEMQHFKKKDKHFTLFSVT